MGDQQGIHIHCSFRWIFSERDLRKVSDTFSHRISQVALFDLQRVVARAQELLLVRIKLFLGLALFIGLIDLAIFADMHKERAVHCGAEVLHINLLFKIGGASLIELGLAGAASHVVRLHMVSLLICSFELPGVMLVLIHVCFAFQGHC